MSYLILTKRGLADLQAGAGSLHSPLWVNPDVLSDEEVGRLRRKGLEITVLSRTVDPCAMTEIDQLVQEIQKLHDGPVWVERALPCAGGAPRLPIASRDAQPVLNALQRMRGKATRFSQRALHHLKRFAASDGPAMIIPYMGFGTATRLTFQGRVLKDEGFASPDKGGTAWDNFIELYKRIGSDEVPGARLIARFGALEQEIVTDDGGYFECEIALPRPLETTGWHGIDLQLIDPAPPAGKAIRATVQVLVPTPTARFGVISDIDDTVLWSNVTNKLKMLAMLAITNAHTRKPFKGVTALYCALRDGVGGNEGNPIFYVSSSPWHLYTPLVDFLQTQGIPLGPLMLKELGIRALFGTDRHHSHKLANIERILQTYPHLPFILIGDSGQQDPEIYKQVVERHPQRVRVIYIRNINPDPARIDAIDRLIEEVRRTDTQLVLVPDSEFAAAHAAAEGLINAAGMSTVRSDKRDDERASRPKI